MKKKILSVLILFLVFAQPVYAESVSDLNPRHRTEHPATQKSAPSMQDMDEKASTKKETVNDYYWDITERETTIRTYFNKGTTRFEVFYSASGTIPFIAFQTTTGDIYESGKDSKNIITRGGNQINGHSDLRYEVIYIKSPSATEDVNVKISLDSKTHDFMLIKSDIPQNWEDIKKEYRTSPEELILWGFHNSENTISDLISIAENIDMNPTDNRAVTAEPPAPPQVNYTKIATIMFIFIAGILGLLLWNNNKTKKKQAKEASKSRVNKRNEISKKNKQKREDSLEHALDRYDDEYSDDDFFSEQEEMDTENIVMPIEKKVAFVEVEEEKPIYKKEEEAKPEISQIQEEPVEKQTPQQTPPVTRQKPSWM